MFDTSIKPRGTLPFRNISENVPISNITFYKTLILFQVSATDPDCGVNAMVNYTLGDGFSKQREFEIRPDTGEICVSSSLDYETRNAYEFPVIATDRGKFYYNYLQ